MQSIMSKGLELRGFGDSMMGGDAALVDLARWIRSGELALPETFVDGLENTPDAFAGVFAGQAKNGKLLVRVRPETASTDS
jgi:NADPH-dependent curcumin reductase CurA